MEHNPYQVSETNISNTIAAHGISGVNVDGEFLVCQSPAVLPNRCMITNKDLTEQEEPIKKNLSWASPWIYLCILLNIIILLIVYFIVRKKLTITYSLKDEVKAQFKKKKNTYVLFAFGSLIAGGLCLALGSNELYAFGFIGLFLFLIFLCIASSKGNHFTIKKFKNGNFYIKGVHPEYLNYIQSQNQT